MPNAGSENTWNLNPFSRIKHRPRANRQIKVTSPSNYFRKLGRSKSIPMKRNATAVWNGTGKEGNGHLSTQSHVLDKKPYSWSARFENGNGTNPEELLAAAHAGCFTMKLSFNLTKAGFTPGQLETNCTVEIDPAKGEIIS